MMKLKNQEIQVMVGKSTYTLISPQMMAVLVAVDGE